MKIICGALLCALSLSAVAQAQSAAMMVTPAQTTNLLRQGTTLRLRTLTPLTSKEAKTGQTFDLETVDDVVINGQIVIPLGSKAKGEITFAKGKGMWGKSGKLETQLLSVRANGTDIALRGTVSQKGETGTLGVIGAIAILPLAGFFVTGTSAELPVGTSFTGFIVNDIPLSFAPQPQMSTPTAPAESGVQPVNSSVTPLMISAPSGVIAPNR